MSGNTSALKTLVVITALGIVGVGFVIVRTSLRNEATVSVSPVPIRAKSSGRLAYLAGPGAGTIFGLAHVVVATADGSDRAALSAQGNLTDVAWSPDGSRIAYVSSGGESGGGTIYVMDADGSNRHTLVEADLGQYLTRVNWSPTGDWIAYDASVGSGEDFEYRIMAIPSRGGSSVTLSSGEGDDLAPAWSPDGTRIAFIRWLGVSTGPITAHLMVMRADGSDLQRIVDLHHVAAQKLAWSPDGRTIAYLDGSRLMLIGGDGGDRHGLYRCTPGCPIGGVSWSPDGARLAITQGDGRSGRIAVLAADGSGVHPGLPDTCCLTWQPVRNGRS